MKDVNFYWQEAFKFTIGAEIGGDWINGGYTNDPLDPGGETKFGISKRAHPNEDIKNLTVDRSKEIYYKFYWLPSNCTPLVTIGFPLTAFVIFDTAFNCGSKTAKKLLQKCLIGIEADGIIGSQTMKAIAKCEDLNLAESILIERQKYYDLIISKNQTLKKFKNGWTNRIKALSKKINELSNIA